VSAGPGLRRTASLLAAKAAYQLPKTVSLVCHDLERQGHQTRPNKHMLMFTNHITQKAKLHLDSQYENLPLVFWGQLCSWLVVSTPLKNIN